MNSDKAHNKKSQS